MGVTFTLTKIKSVGDHTPADYRNDNGELSATATPGADDAWQVTDTVYYGKTDDQGKITSWYTNADMTGTAVSNLAADPNDTTKTVRTYFVLQETDSPYNDYSKSENSVFDLPYRTTNIATDADGTVTSKEDGYVYNLSVFPKNVNTKAFSKVVTDINGDPAASMAKVGDVINYALTYKLAGVKRPEPTEGASPDYTKVYLDDFDGTTANTGIRIADRLSSALQFNNATAEIQYQNENGVAQTPTQLTENTDYTRTEPTDVPTQIGGTTPLFNGSNAHSKYEVFDFFNGHAGSSYNIPENSKNVAVVVNIKVKVVSTDDTQGHNPGYLVNDAAEDAVPAPGHHDEHHDQSFTASAGFQFAKVHKGDFAPVEGAVFRLTKPGHPDEYLASDGNFYKEDSSTHQPVDAQGHAVADTTFVQATSNDKGLVTFTALPIFAPDSSTSGTTTTHTYKFNDADHLTFDVLEYLPANGYDKPTMAFEKVSWANEAGQAITAADSGKRFLPDGTTVDTDGTVTASTLDFKQWGTTLSGNAIIKNDEGKNVTNALMNWKHGDSGKPIDLPLTGGKGIILLLALGAVIMAIVIIDRKRRAARNN